MISPNTDNLTNYVRKAINDKKGAVQKPKR